MTITDTLRAMNPMSNIVIVGGGTAGWLAAAMLCHHLKRSQYNIQLVESEEVSTIGIGESTVPPFVGLVKRLGIDENEFMRATEGTFKLGIQFSGWHQQTDTYFHPFGVIGKPIEQYDFYQCWLKARSQGDTSALHEFSPCSVMAEQGRFFHPERARNTPIGGANYAYHVDASLVARFLRQYAETRGLRHTSGKVSHITQKQNGFINSVILEDGREITGDFFIDSTGFKSLLLGKLLNVDHIDWSEWLPCDRAIAIKSEHAEPIRPYTRAIAQSAGWMWQIPLQHRVGQGYVYASAFCSDTTARSTLLRKAGKVIEEPRVIPFVTGHRRQIWKHNCLALGLAAGFIEPLEATAIHLITRGLDFFLRYFPDQECSPALANEYNRRVIGDFEEIRDFIVLHYCATSREDSAFWRHCQQIVPPNSLRERIELFKEQGTLRDGTDELFRATSWQSVFEGMGIRPAKYSPRIENLDYNQIVTSLKTAKQAIQGMVAHLPSHQDFLHSQRSSAN